jgi:hypothetical protein
MTAMFDGLIELKIKGMQNSGQNFIAGVPETLMPQRNG